MRLYQSEQVINRRVRFFKKSTRLLRVSGVALFDALVKND